MLLSGDTQKQDLDENCLPLLWKENESMGDQRREMLLDLLYNR